MKNLIIAGGGLVNKGAQAMTLIAICELKKRFPDHQVYLLAWNTSPEERERFAMYDLELLQVPALKFADAASNPLKKMVYSMRYGEAFRKTDEIYRNAELLVDVSGYALGSNWSAKICNDYLDNIQFALAYGVPVYLLPQSFGPFDFKDAEGMAVDRRIRELLPRVRLACAREDDGFQALSQRYGLNDNLMLANDLVLASKVRDYSPAMKQAFHPQLPAVAPESMCVIPNERVRDASGCGDPEVLYRAAIEAGLSCGLTVYITYHSNQDQAVCANLKKHYADNEQVILLDRDHNCMEFNELVRQFRFVVGSRFHAIVHSLKNGVPCIALGWAVKYADLLNAFDQKRYMFDIREQVTPEAIRAAVLAMAENYEEESRVIQTRLPALQEVNVFDQIRKSNTDEN